MGWKVLEDNSSGSVFVILIITILIASLAVLFGIGGYFLGGKSLVDKEFIDKGNSFQVAGVPKTSEDKTEEATKTSNQALEKKLVPTPTPTPTPTLTPTKAPTPTTIKPTETKVSTTTSENSSQKLTLSVVSNEPGKANMTWTLDGDPINGFKEVWADHANPTYPEDHWNYDADTNLRSYTFQELPSGQTLHFRVGVYKSGQGVVAYSNDVTLTIK